VTRLDANLPYGYETRVLAVVPAVAVTLSPSQVVVPLGTAEQKVRLRVEVVNNVEGKSEGMLRLDLAGRLEGRAIVAAISVRARG
jgi:hypothetical protein